MIPIPGTGREVQSCQSTEGGYSRIVTVPASPSTVIR